MSHFDLHGTDPQLSFPSQLLLGFEVFLSFSWSSTQATAPHSCAPRPGTVLFNTQDLPNSLTQRKPVGDKLRMSDPYIFAARGDPKSHLGHRGSEDELCKVAGIRMIRILHICC